MKEELPYLPLRFQRPEQTFKLAARANDRFLTDPRKIFRRVYTLLDPISKQRIENPVRGQSCTHVECFDEKTFLRANRRKLDWRCPVANCSEKIAEDQLIVDGLFVLILNKTFQSCTSFELDTNGGWCPIYRDKVFRTRTVDLENDFSEGEDDEEEEAQPKSPESPLSPIEVPPEPEEPIFTLEPANGHDMNGDDPMLAVSREAQTQTWEQTFEVERSGADFSANQDQEMSGSNDGNQEARSSGAPVTVIQRVDDEERASSRSQEMEDVD